MDPARTATVSSRPHRVSTGLTQAGVTRLTPLSHDTSSGTFLSYDMSDRAPHHGTALLYQTEHK